MPEPLKRGHDAEPRQRAEEGPPDSESSGHAKTRHGWKWGMLSALLVILAATSVLAVVRRHSRHRRAQFELSVARKYLERGEDQEALQHLTRSIEAKPDYLAYWILADVFMKQGRLGPAEESLKNAVELAPDRMDVRCALAETLAAQHKVIEAIEQYRIALELEPNSAFVHNQLGAKLAETGRNSEAIGHFERAVALDPKNADTHKALGYLLNLVGEHRKAFDHLQKAVELDPKDAVAVNSLARLLSTCSMEGVRDGARAVELAEELCIATQYSIVAYVDTLAAAYAEAGRFAEAVEMATKAVSLEESEPVVRELRKRLDLYKNGKRYRADIPHETAGRR